ncbi:MAG TPA: ABC transporter ATP-binding protein [Pyrinomonadaceae bacterium]|nr:ABC transporter ATP-binding protein [Pyrinomonadaceae bacterium]
MIELSGLTKRFGEFVAVHDLNLRVPKGVVFGFLGPNGSGKSTTVKMLTGILQPSAGDAWIDGASIRSAPLEIKQKIGVLPEDLALFDSLTIWEHLKMCGPIYGLSRAETEARAEQLLNYLDLWIDRHTFVEQASFGMRKKCALAMALLHNPKVLFLDEPFEGIDPVTSRSIKDLLIHMSEKGITIFLTSHILEVVERLVHSFALVVHGELVCTQTMEETLSSGRTLEDIYFQYVTRRPVEEFEWIG